MYTVNWQPTALADVNAIDARIDAATRMRVAAAVQQLDSRLKVDPLNEGESRDAGRRIGMESPGALLFEIDIAGRRVGVLACWLY